MKWLEPYIKPRKTVSNFNNVGAEQEFDEDTGEESRPITPGSETDSEPALNSSCISRYCGELECSRFHMIVSLNLNHLIHTCSGLCYYAIWISKMTIQVCAS